MPTNPKCLKEDNVETAIWNEQQSAINLLKKFQDFGFRLNGACDAEDDSFDGMVLLTGRGDNFTDVGRGWLKNAVF